MDKRILKRHLGKSSIKNDPRKQELIKDSINLKQWDINIRYYLLEGQLEEWQQFDEENMSDDDKQAIHKVTEKFANIVEGMKRPIFYPQALRFENMYWYIAAYPDVVDFFFPTYDFMKSKKANRSNQPLGNIEEFMKKTEKSAELETANLRKKHEKIGRLLTKFENHLNSKYGNDFFQVNEQNGKSDVNLFVYFVELKNLYKSKTKLALAK